MQAPDSPAGPGEPQNPSVASALFQQVAAGIARDGGWWPFDRLMHAALYTPGLGYYARDDARTGSRPFGLMPQSGSDFVTAPELSPLFGAALARQVRQALQATGTHQLLEFGAGSGALAEQLLQALDAEPAAGPPVDYAIVEVSAALRARQQQRLARWGQRVRWLDRLPAAPAGADVKGEDAIAPAGAGFDGVIIGNEVLDAMPVQLLHHDGRQWLERGVALAADGASLCWSDRPTALRPPADVDPEGFVPGSTVEIHPQAEAFMRSVAALLRRGLALFIDYGFPQAEYYHPQRLGGTLMCHRAHRADDRPLVDLGEKDITAHVNFTAIALAAQDAGLDVLGYTSQARFLLNCGLTELLAEADLRQRAMAQKLITEHEMGELFKVIALGRGCPPALLGFAAGDRTHRL